MAEPHQPLPTLNINYNQQNERVDLAVRALESMPRVGNRELFLLDGEFGVIDHCQFTAGKLEDVEVPTAFADRCRIVSGSGREEIAQVAKPELWRAVLAELMRLPTTKLRRAERCVPHAVVGGGGELVSGIAFVGTTLVACKPMRLNSEGNAAAAAKLAKASARRLLDLFREYSIQRDDLVSLLAFIVGLRVLDLPTPAVLFLGPPGTGKTQLAQALAPGPREFAVASVEGSTNSTGRQVQGLELRSVLEDSPHGVVLDEVRVLSGGTIGSLVSLKAEQTLLLRLVGRGKASRIRGGRPLVLTSNRITIDEHYVRRLVLVEFQARDAEPVFALDMPGALRSAEAERDLLRLARWSVRESARFGDAPRLPGFERFSRVGHAVADACGGRFLTDRERLASLVGGRQAGRADSGVPDPDDALVSAVENGACTAKEVALRVGRGSESRSVGMALRQLAEKAGRISMRLNTSTNMNEYFPLASGGREGALS